MMSPYMYVKYFYRKYWLNYLPVVSVSKLMLKVQSLAVPGIMGKIS